MGTHMNLVIDIFTIFMATELEYYRSEETGVTRSGIRFDFFGSERITGRWEVFGILPISLPGTARSNSKARMSVNNKALVLLTREEKNIRNPTVGKIWLGLTPRVKIGNRYKLEDPQ